MVLLALRPEGKTLSREPSTKAFMRAAIFPSEGGNTTPLKMPVLEAISL